MRTVKFHKGECGVEFLLNVLTDQETDYTHQETYHKDFFEILFFKKAKGQLILAQQVVELEDNCIIFISAFQKHTWEVDADHLEFTTLIFQEDFLNEFFSDKLFTYKLLYFYQLSHSPKIIADDTHMSKFCNLLTEIKSELVHTEPDSAHIIRSLLYYLLQTLNRKYAKRNGLPSQKPENNFAYQFKRLLEQHIKQRQRIADYSMLMGISRITLNNAVKTQFNITASQLLKQRLLFEVQELLIHSNKSINEIAFELNFSEPNHLMRFFKAQTGKTISTFTQEFRS
ncbi:helix-turn-helix transcriptional regulator [Sphingobacterium sp. N143]|uniref:helix-turn-helix domain-containing protein n=1 Tax=Sphingobacterium sp. N143 TaxID=2746727 RepID=UPI0025784594|nr:AraC family transcriptional regulator [Sphingobacterium sp. N143]MDM1293037.1 helix-turn-helix transcriptional regulator [Sphingobacterium sp. N143]